jgi:integrase/recombinase XerC
MMIGSWITYLSNQGRSEHTIASYRRALKQFIQWSEQTYGQPFDPAAIIPRDIADWKSFQQTIRKAAPATINQRLAALSNFFSVGDGHRPDRFRSGGRYIQPAARSP